MHEENEWDQIADADNAEGQIQRVMRQEMMDVFKQLKIGKTPGSSEVNAETIPASGDVGIEILMEPYRRTLDGNGMLADRATSVAIPIIYGKGEITN